MRKGKSPFFYLPLPALQTVDGYTFTLYIVPERRTAFRHSTVVYTVITVHINQRVHVAFSFEILIWLLSVAVIVDERPADGDACNNVRPRGVQIKWGRGAIVVGHESHVGGWMGGTKKPDKSCINPHTWGPHSRPHTATLGNAHNAHGRSKPS